MSDYVFSSAMSFMVGFVFFGGPVIERMVRMLDENVPGWQEKIELRKCVGSRLLSLPVLKATILTFLRDFSFALPVESSPAVQPTLNSPCVS